MSGATDQPTVSVPAPEPPITVERVQRLKRLCLARYPGDRKMAKQVYRQIRGIMATMKPETQDITLDSMAAALAEMRAEEQKNIAQTLDAQNPAAVDALCASIMQCSRLHPVHDSVSSPMSGKTALAESLGEQPPPATTTP